MNELHLAINTELDKRYPGCEFRYPIRDGDFQNLLNWPLRLDGRGWPQQTCFDNTALNVALVLVRVEVVTGSEQPLQIVVLVRYRPLADNFLDSAEVLAVHEEKFFVPGFSQTARVGDGQFVIISKLANTQNKPHGPPRFIARYLPAEEGKADCLQRLQVRGNITGATIRLWFNHSPTGQFCALPSEWHGPGHAQWTSLLIVDVWNGTTVAAFTTDGQCFLPNKPFEEWSISDESISMDRTCHFDHSNTVTYSPDGCLLAVWQQGPRSTLRILDCERVCELPISQRVPQPSYPGVPAEFLFAGTAAFDPASVGADGRASRLAYTSKSGGGEAAHARFAVDHTVSVCDVRGAGRPLWHCRRPHCVDQLCYDRYGTVLAATAMTSLNADNSAWQVLLFAPTTGDVLASIATPPGMYQLYCAPLATSLLLLDFLAASRSQDPRPRCEAISVAFPTLRQLARMAAHRRLHTQAAVASLPLPAALKTYLCCSLPVAMA